MRRHMHSPLADARSFIRHDLRRPIQKELCLWWLLDVTDHRKPCSWYIHLCTECCTIFLVSQDNQRPSGFNRQVKIPRPEALCTNNYGGIGSVSRNVRESKNLKIFPKPTWLDCDREKRCFKSWQSVVKSAFLVGKKSPASSKYFWTLVEAAPGWARPPKPPKPWTHDFNSGAH